VLTKCWFWVINLWLSLLSWKGPKDLLSKPVFISTEAVKDVAFLGHKSKSKNKSTQKKVNFPLEWDSNAEHGELVWWLICSCCVRINLWGRWWVTCGLQKTEERCTHQKRVGSIQLDATLTAESILVSFFQLLWYWVGIDVCTKLSW